MNRRFTLVACVLGFTAVGLGAMGAHGIKAMLADASDAAQRLGWWETGARYHFFHALAVGLVAAVADKTPHRAASWAAWLFVAGTLLFSGSLYVMTVTGVKALGAVTPLGGVCFLSGWVALGVAARTLPAAK